VSEYVPRSRLADAKIPMGATVTHIYRAKHWRNLDARNGDGYARRMRIRIRKLLRAPIVFDPVMLVNDPRAVSVTRTVPPSHKGYVA
jgi:hypothetical protein